MKHSLWFERLGLIEWLRMKFQLVRSDIQNLVTPLLPVSHTIPLYISTTDKYHQKGFVSVLGNLHDRVCVLKEKMVLLQMTLHSKWFSTYHRVVNRNVCHLKDRWCQHLWTHSSPEGRRYGLMPISGHEVERHRSIIRSVLSLKWFYYLTKKLIHI